MERVVSLILLCCLLLTGCSNSGVAISSSDLYRPLQAEADESRYRSERNAYSSECSFMYEDICFSRFNVEDGTDYDFSGTAVLCFDITSKEVIYAHNIFNKVYPASTTKLMTALLAVTRCDPDSYITIKEDNCGITVAGAQLCGFRKGDRVTVKDMLYCLLIYSGNDAGVALAETISADEEGCVALMNELAASLGCTGTHFVNTHGLHNIDHYTTAFDMYLIFNECLKYPELREIFSCEGVTVQVTNSLDGTTREMYMEPTNLYYEGSYTAPDGITVLGGKTGDTSSAGKCLVLYSENSEGHHFITEIFRAPDKKALYTETNELLKLCIAESFQPVQDESIGG